MPPRRTAALPAQGGTAFKPAQHHVQESNMSREASVYPGSRTISRWNFVTKAPHRRNVAHTFEKKIFDHAAISASLRSRT
jgi:hypothetical protein